MNKVKKVIIATIGVVLSAVLLCSCTEAERVTYNVQKEADNFNVTRRLSVINARSDKPVLELIGNFSISNNEENELVVTIEVAPNVYKVDYVYLNDWVMYTIEDVSGAYVDKYHYEMNFLPEMIIPITFTSKD